jgi:hypothetical protein
VAVQISYTDGEYFDTSKKTPIGWVIASSAETGALTEPPISVSVEGIFPGEEK